MKLEILSKSIIKQFWKIYHSIDITGKTNYEVFLQALDEMIEQGIIDKSQRYNLWKSIHYKERNHFRKLFKLDGMFVKGYFVKKKRKKIKSF